MTRRNAARANVSCQAHRKQGSGWYVVLFLRCGYCRANSVKRLEALVSWLRSVLSLYARCNPHDRGI
jgi:hypothetical protein